MKPVLTLLALAVILAPAAPSLAQPGSADGPPPAYGQGGAAGQGGGGVTLAEFQARYRARLMRADTDHDGRISLSEFMAARERQDQGQGSGDGQGSAEGQGGQGRNPTRQFQILDSNRDGYVTPAEIDAVSAQRFARMDANHDGVLTPEERAASRGRRSYGGEGGSAVQPLPPPQ